MNGINIVPFRDKSVNNEEMELISFVDKTGVRVCARVIKETMIAVCGRIL